MDTIFPAPHEGVSDIGNCKRPPPGAWAYHVNQFCRLAQISRSTFWKHVKEGKIKVVKVAGRTLITEAERRRLLEEAA